ncbi:PREDICTED: integrin-alpha FG-GAP repeat-containing protein 2-like [Ceratosolen solmsi marchali]|uniref:Integrin-alpha FG-GAP repeat-containing protein 2-like n=1 Tax=Ceratosolen solmsi marchali TaxID=326594 RepID=A0AAJ6YBE7_9HYME|nr:PREDICTED: integrin-alpha FG-GAP repeat-containing protein 2-like [Ceratosolen solmsi marchali]
MRAVCFVKRLQWDLPGTLFRHGLTIGDVDNDGDNELVVGTAEGDLYIFKGLELWQKITGLGLITSIAIGDIFNYGRNALIVICGDGWVHIYYSPRSVHPSINTLQSEGSGSDNGEISEQHATKFKTGTSNLINATEFTNLDHRININRSAESVGKMPTNTKIVLVADVDKDGANEMIIGLTDRVVRSYRWSSNVDLGTGKLVGLNKWECANQIGTVTLQEDSDGTPTLLVAQPGGTFMRIKCNADDYQLEEDCFDTNSEAAASCVDYQTLGISRMRNQNISTEILGNLNPKKTHSSNDNNLKIGSAIKTKYEYNNLKYSEEESVMVKERYKNTSEDVDSVDGNLIGGNIVFEEFDNRERKIHYNKSCEYSVGEKKNANEKDSEVKLKEQKQQINLKSKEEIKTWSNTKSYALATLDGTIMLVKDEIILWSMQVDHHISALCSLDVTGDGADEIIACTWDGQTYILDQQRNSVRFQFEEPVRAFCAGMYSVFPQSTSPCLVYNNFFNKIFLYYDVSLPSMVITALNPEETLDSKEKNLLNEILKGKSDSEREVQLKQLTEWLLYGMF